MERLGALSRRLRPALRIQPVALVALCLGALACVVLLTLWMRLGTGRVREDDPLAQRCGVDSALALAVDSVWGRFLAQRGGREPSIPELRLYLDGLGVTDQAQLAEPERVDLLSVVELPRDEQGRFALSGAVIDRLDVMRVDGADGMRLSFRARAPGVGREDADGSLERSLDLEIRLE